MIEIKDYDALAEIQGHAQECCTLGADHVLVELAQKVCAETGIDGPDRPLCLYVIPAKDGKDLPTAWLGLRSQFVAQ